VASLTRRESIERQQAVLDYFLSEPFATGDEAQQALISGKLTGATSPPMGLGMLFRIKRRAEEMRRGATTAGTAPSAPGLQPDARPGRSPPTLENLRDATTRLQRVLAEMPDVAEVRVTARDAKVVRNVVTEESL